MDTGTGNAVQRSENIPKKGNVTFEVFVRYDNMKSACFRSHSYTRAVLQLVVKKESDKSCLLHKYLVEDEMVSLIEWVSVRAKDVVVSDTRACV